MIAKHAYVFPGQGSQSIGMLSELALAYPFIIDLFTKISDRIDFDLWELIQHGPEDLLNQTQYTQVAMLAADVAVYQVLRKENAPAPSFMAGHSLGEYAALVCADAVDVTDAAHLVYTRGKLMQETVPLGVGAMGVIIGLSDDDVNLICEQASGVTEQVMPANYNAIGQVVIAGHTKAVDVAMNQAMTQGARMAKIIPVSVPCHCSLLKAAAEPFENELKATHFEVPSIPVISNVDLSIYHSQDHIRSLLKEQLYRPVRWVETIQQFKHEGVSTVIECGPGKVLSGLIKRIERSIGVACVYDPASLDEALAMLRRNDNESTK